MPYALRFLLRRIRRTAKIIPSSPGLPNYYIWDCKQADFDAHKFYDPDTQGKKEMTVEGKKYFIEYYLKDKAQAASALEIRRNYINAVKKIGGSAYESGYHVYTKFVKGGLEVWADVDSYASPGYSWYELTIIEKKEMSQQVVADAKTMGEGIEAVGHVAVYGIYFDFNKAELKPESEPALKEITQTVTTESEAEAIRSGAHRQCGRPGL